MVDVDVPLLEVAFIELFSGKGFMFLSSLIFFSVPNCERLGFLSPLAVWTLEDLISSVGSIDHGPAIKALSSPYSQISH